MHKYFHEKREKRFPLPVVIIYYIILRKWYKGKTEKFYFVQFPIQLGDITTRQEKTKM